MKNQTIKLKNLLKTTLIAPLICYSFETISQVVPPKQWDKRFGGDQGGESINSLQQTTDGGYILGGNSSSGISGDKTETSRGNDDFWVVKINNSGTKEWDKRFGGGGTDVINSLQQTADGGYILGGNSNSGAGGDKTEASRGNYDYWIVKIDENGTKQWDKRYGGSLADNLNALQQTADGGYILGGRSASGISGDKSEASQGSDDFWVVKIDENGLIKWDKTFGGGSNDQIHSLQQTADGGYILGGYSNSGISGDKTEANQGFFDYWVIKIDENGVKQWDKTFGGSQNDLLFSLQQTIDGGYILGGYSASGISGDKTEASQGGDDFWVVKIDENGVKVWDKTFGGNDVERLFSLQQTTDGGYILGGESLSGISGDKTETSRGNFDFWVVKINVAGTKEWDKTFGGNENERLYSLQQTADGAGYILGGRSLSGISGDKTEASRGGFDFWVVRIGFPVWTGNLNTNWNETGNWSTGLVPNANDNVIIPSNLINYPVLEVNSSLNNLEMVSGASLIINPNQTLTINGTLTNNGTITVESGGALVQGGASTLAGTGNYMVRRAVNAGQKMVGSPINNHSVSGFGITPTGTNGGQIVPLADCNATSIDPSSPYGDIMELREDASPIHNCTQSLWHVKSTGNLTNARGYAVNVATNATLEFSGTINNGNISYANLGRQANLLDQPSTGQQTGGWHLVSNPYPSPIRLSNGSLGADWDNSVHFFDGTNFVTVQLNLTNAVIPVGHAFQIRKTAVGGSANFNVTNSLREGGNPTFYAPAQLMQQHINVTLSNNQYQSKTTVYFEDGATSNFDPQYDAVKLFGAHYLPQLYTVETSALAEKLAYNALTPLYQENQQSVVMGAFTPTAGDFQLTFDGSNTVSGTVVLEDKKLNTFTNITENFTYSFTTANGDNDERFVLHFDATPDNTSARSKMEGTIKMFPNPSSDYTTLMFPEKHPFNTINIVDLSGRTVNSIEIKNQSNTLLIDTKEMSKGIYFVQILGSTNTEVLKLMVK
jgi:hypothetical protein